MPDATANLGNVPVGADAVSVTVISDALKRADRIFGQSHFAPNPDTHVEGGSPLFGHRGGTLRKNNVVAALAAGTTALTVNNTNYIEVYMDGSNNVIMAVNTTGFTAGRIPLFSVVVAAGGTFITAITDRRVFLGDLALVLPLTVTNGGTGLSTVVLGDLLYASAADTISRLAGNITTTKKFISQTGNGTISAAPVLETIDVSDVTNLQTLLDALLPLAGGTMSGGLIMADQLLTRPEIKDYAETVVVNATSGAAATINLEAGNVYAVTLTAACTFTFSNPPATGKNGSITLYLTQDATGSRLATWPASVKWAGGTAPTLSTAANAVDILVFTTRDGGTTWYGGTFGLNFS